VALDGAEVGEAAHADVADRLFEALHEHERGDDGAADGEIGVCIDTHELVEDLVASCADINVFPVIAVRFERFADGRGYSIATLLRTRYGYRGQLRAVGDVLRDQLFLMKRCGFNAFAVRADRDIEVALAGLRDFSEPYQGAVDDPQPVWRRHARN